MRKNLIMMLVGLFLAGCGVATTRLNIIYKPLGIHRIGEEGTKLPTIYIQKFDVGKTIKDKYIIGEARTGFFNKKTPITSEKPIDEIITLALSKAFKKAGFIIDNDVSNADLLVNGTVDRLWVEEYATGFDLEYCRAIVRFDILVKEIKSNKIIWADSIIGHSTSRKTMDATSQNEPTLADALQKAIGSIFEDKVFVNKIRDFSKLEE